MKSEKQQPWQINLHSKTKFFDFKFKAANITSKHSPFPIKLNFKLKLCPSLLQSKKSEPQISRKRKSIKSKSLQILEKIKPGPTKKKTTATKPTSDLQNPEAHFPSNRSEHFALEDPICISSIVSGFIALLIQSISEEDLRRVVLYSLIIFLYIALIFKKVIKWRKRTVLVVVIVAMLSCAIGVYLSTIFKFSEGYVSDWVWKVFNYVPSSQVPPVGSLGTTWSEQL